MTASPLPAQKISSSQFLSLNRPAASQRFELPITAKLTGGMGSLFGGVGLAAGVVALEQAAGKPAVWATGQYVSLTEEGTTLDLQVLLPAVGRTVTQGRVIGTHAGSEIINILGAVGQRTSDVAGLWMQFPDAGPPNDAERLQRQFDTQCLHDHVEVRMARGMFGFSGQGTPSGDGNSLLWVRMPGVEHDAGALAILADYSPSVLGNAIGRAAGSTSLDNTIRFTTAAPTAGRDSEWILLDNALDWVGDGFGHLTSHMWSEDGTLLATASQSMIART